MFKSSFTLSDLLDCYPTLNSPQVSRRALLAVGSLMAVGIQGCGSGSDSPSGTGGNSGSGPEVTTLAGSSSGFQDGTGAGAKFSVPRAITADSGGNVYVADMFNNRIRMITAAGVVTTLAGSSTSGSADGTGANAQFDFPQAIAWDGSGSLYVADTSNHLIRKVVISTGVVTTLAGSTQGSTDGTGIAAQFHTPCGIAVDSNGDVYVGDTGNHRIRKITSVGVVTTLAGSTQGATDGVGTAAEFYMPRGLCVSGSDLYVADSSNQRIRKIDVLTGTVTTLAGSTQGATDGVGTAATFSGPTGLVVDQSGDLYVADSNNHLIRKVVVSTGVVTTLAGSTQGATDGAGTAAKFSTPYCIATDGTGHLYVADSGNHRIRKITL
jgi:sugar lactone lactonase YvrE